MSGILDRLRPKPPQPTPPVPQIRSVRPTLHLDPGVVPVSTYTLDDGRSKVGTWIPESGLALVDLPADWPAPFGCTLNVKAVGYEDFSVHFALADFSQIPPDATNSALRIQTTAFLGT